MGWHKTPSPFKVPIKIKKVHRPNYAQLRVNNLRSIILISDAFWPNETGELLPSRSPAQSTLHIFACVMNTDYPIRRVRFSKFGVCARGRACVYTKIIRFDVWMRSVRTARESFIVWIPNAVRIYKTFFIRPVLGIRHFYVTLIIFDKDLGCGRSRMSACECVRAHTCCDFGILISNRIASVSVSFFFFYRPHLSTAIGWL